MFLIRYSSLTNIYFFYPLVPFHGRLCYGIAKILLQDFNLPEKIKGGMDDMKPRGTWIAICMIVAVGLFSTDYVKKKTEGNAEMTITASASFSDLPERIPEYAESEEESEKNGDVDGTSVPIPFSAMDETGAMGLNTSAEKDVKRQENNQLFVRSEAASLSGNHHTEKEDSVINQMKKLAEEDVKENPSRVRLQELDDQIARNCSREQDTTAISRKTRAENEWALWETELQRILNILKENLDTEEQEALMQQQKEWMRSREKIGRAHV